MVDANLLELMNVVGIRNVVTYDDVGNDMSGTKFARRASRSL